MLPVDVLVEQLARAVQQLCFGAGGELLAAVAHCNLIEQQNGQVLAPFYQSWRSGLLDLFRFLQGLGLSAE